MFNHRMRSLVLCGLLFAAAVSAHAATKLNDLRCEYLANPLGIDAAQPRLSWGLESSLRGAAQTAYEVLVASDERKLARDEGDLWDSGRVASDQSVLVPYAGKPLESGMRCFWKVRVWDQNGEASPWSASARWSMGLLHAEDWKGAWIGADWMKDNEGPLPWFRKEVTLSGDVRRATAYVCALGYYELYVNGEKVDDQVLSPAVSNYGKRGLYITHDIAKYLKPGVNCIGLWLGRGWHMHMLEAASHEGPLVKAQIEVEAANGEHATIATDASWKMRASCITPLGRMTSGDYGGEHYDARKADSAWSTPGFEDQGWKEAKTYSPPTPLLKAQMVEPNRIIETFGPAAIEAKDDGFVVDMGKHYTGWFELRFPQGLKSGREVNITYVDKWLPDNETQTFHQRDTYVAAGGKDEAFRNHFNYHAFRWAIVKGLPAAPRKEDIRGMLISTDYAPAAEFACSNPLLNDIYRTILHTYRCLSLGGYTVDCPHRERLGYGGDSGTSMEMGMMNFRVAAFYSKWAADWRDAQNDEGDVPYIAPMAQYAGGGPVWSGFCITMPWQLYLQYGDKQVLEQSYPIMKRWLGFIDGKVKDGLLERYVGIGNDEDEWSYLGDWVPPGRKQGKGRVDETSTRFFNNLYYLYCLQLTSKVAGALGQSDDAALYAAKAAELAPRLHERFLNPGEATYVNREQPYLAMPLLFGVTPEALRPQVMANLENDILVTQKGHLNTGMHGTYFMAKYFIAQRRNDLVYSIVSQDTYPSWGYMLKQGATTIWEEWDADNSQIHNTLISIGLWFIEGLGGIRYDEKAPGFKHIIVSPGVVEPLAFAKASFQSPYGKIVSDWKKADDTLWLNLTVPPNTTATLILPAKSADGVQEDGKDLAAQPGIANAAFSDGALQCEVGAGSYQFSSRLK